MHLFQCVNLPQLTCHFHYWLTSGILGFFALQTVPLWKFYFMSLANLCSWFFLLLLLLSIYLELLDHRVCIYAVTIDATKLISKWVIPIIFTAVLYKCSTLSIFWASTWHFPSFFFYFWQEYWGSCCDLNVQFPDNNEHLLQVYWLFDYSLWWCIC